MKDRKPLILGSGYVAQAFAKAWGVTPLSRAKVDYTSQYRLLLHITHQRPSVIVNCAGFAGRPNIDECEVKRGETLKANLVLPANLSRTCAESAIPFVHISSGCIFHGGTHAEDDSPDEPLSFYSRTKWLAEQTVNGYVLRIRMPFDNEPHPRSLLSKLASYDTLIDEPNSLTYLPDLVAATEALLTHKAPLGVYHVTNYGYVSHSDIALIFGWRKMFVKSLDGLCAAPRSNCILETAKLSQYFRMPDVRQRLNEVARAMKAAA